MNSSPNINSPERWDRPFGPDMTENDVDRALEFSALGAVDPNLFPKNRPLREIIKNDGRIVHYKRGDIIIRNGDYGNSVFLILQGCVRIVINEPREQHRPKKGRRSFFRAVSQLWRNATVPERRDVSIYENSASKIRRGEVTSAQVHLTDVSGYIATHETIQLAEGTSFGEIAALSRTPRTATVFAETELELLELRWQGLRDIRRRDAGIRETFNQHYRKNRLEAQLRSSPLLAHLDTESLGEIIKHTLLEMYGSEDWFYAYMKIEARESSDVIAAEPVIIEQHSYLDGLLLICSGHARLSEGLDHGERTVGYLKSNDAFGLEEIMDQWRNGTELLAQRSLRAVGHVEVLRIPTALVEKHILPSLPASLLPELKNADNVLAWDADSQEKGLEQSLLDFFTDQRIINGTETMMINTARCTGCDDCVRACAATHDNNPRFIRHGPVHGNIQVANSCMHCADPVCLVECPTGAIGQSVIDGRVMIDDPLCIGCGNCANSCPYNNIQLVEVRNRSGDFIIDTETSAPIVKATKCDLCFGQLGGPACQRACPHDALVRMDLHNMDEVLGWIGK